VLIQIAASEKRRKNRPKNEIKNAVASGQITKKGIVLAVFIF
jgi:hypothetical protein